MLQGFILSCYLFLPLVFSTHFTDPFIPIKYNLLLILTSLSLIIFLSKFKTSKLNFEFSQYQLCYLLILMAIYCFHLFSPSSLFNEQSLVNYFAIYSLAFLQFTLFQKDKNFLHEISFFTSIAAFLVGIVGILQESGFTIAFLPKGPGATSTLSNVNMVAQYLGLSIPLILYNHSQLSLKKKIFSEVVVSICLAYITLILCRSVLIGVILLAFISIYFRYFSIKFYCKISAYTLIFCSTPFISNLLIFSGSKTIRIVKAFDAKISSSTGRTVIWKNSLQMITENPIGYGPASFEFMFNKFNLINISDFSKEHYIFWSPHNEILRLLAEEGFLFLIITILFLASYIIKALKNTYHQYSEYKKLIIMLIPIFVGESLFQFPFILPIGILFSSLLLGLCFYINQNDENKKIYLPFKNIFLTIIAVVLCFVSTRNILTDYITSNRIMNLSLVQKLYQINPNSWRLGNHLIMLEFTENNIDSARKISDQILSRAPYLFPIIHSRFLIEQKNNLETSCKYAIQYDSLFQNNSSLHQYRERFCEKVPF